jgi:hypothetical protein
MSKFVCLIVLAVCTLLAATCNAPQAAAQSSGKLAELPVLIMRNNGITTRTMMEYVQTVSEELDIGKNIITAMDQQDVDSMMTKHSNPASGTMMYMVQGLIPALEQIEFSEVIDEAEFEQLVRAQKTQMGDGATLTGSDGKYTQVFTNTWREDVTDEPAEEQTEDTNEVRVSVSLGSSGGGVQVNNGMSQDEEIIDENGRKYRQHSFTMTRYFRYNDGFMFTSSYEDLFTTSLPSRQTLLGGSESGHDAELQFFPDRVPVGFKHLFWGTINASAGADLQQRDEEDDVDYGVRRSGGDIGLTIVKTLLFDTEFISGSIRLANATEPVRGELKLAAREHSNFANDLGEIAAATSRFSPVLNDDAAATLHLALKLSDSSRSFLTSLGTWIRVRLSDAAGRDIDLAIAGSEIEETLEGVAEHGNLEAFVKVGWTPSSDGVIYGGVQVDDNPQLLRNLYNLMTGDDLPTDAVERLSIGKKGDLQMIQFAIPNAPAGVPVNLTHAFLCHAEGCLWFAAGSDHCWDILRQSIERCRNAVGLRQRTPLFTAQVDVAKWMAFPQDDPTGIGSLPDWGDSALSGVFMDSLQVRSAGTEVSSPAGDEARSKGPTGLMQRVIDMGGSQAASLELFADKSGVSLRGSLGAALGRYLIAQWLATIDAAMQNIPTPQEAVSEAVEEEELAVPEK